MTTLNLSKIFNSNNLVVNHFDLSASAIGEHIPSLNKNYVFNSNSLNEILLFLTNPFNDCLYISGASGCGKTTAVLQIAARLGWGVQQITLSNKCESIDLIGHSTLKKGELVYEYGALTKAMLNGEILLLNEIDLMSAGDLSVLNDVLDGKPLTIIANNGEVIYPHKDFRVIATANTKGLGDDTGFYSGARILNQAFLDRFRFLEMSYPSIRTEIITLKQAFPSLSDELTVNLCRMASDIRKIVSDGIENGTQQLSAPFSTRTLLKIAGILSLNTKYTVEDVVKMAFSLRLPKEEQEFISRLVKDIFGHSTVELEKTNVNDLGKQIDARTMKKAS